MSLPTNKFTKTGVAKLGYEMLPPVSSTNNGESMIVSSGAWTTGNILPVVTASDNGKVLAVVSGKWEAKSLG